jgi:hypothetical protein
MYIDTEIIKSQLLLEPPSLGTPLLHFDKSHHNPWL